MQAEKNASVYQAGGCSAKVSICNIIYTILFVLMLILMLIFVSLSFETASVKELVVTVSMTVKNEYLIKWLQQHIFKCGFKYFLKKN